MAYKKSRGFRKKKRLVNNPMYTSPDGGETVYQELPNGDKKLIEQSQLAKDTEQEMYEQEMVGVDAIKLRRKYPALQKAWNQYKTVWKLVAYND
jgi:outer membrane lipopolysaccharide assembly protein LptE/RlpB